MEMISSSHDALTISTWIEHFKSGFYKKYACYPVFHDFVTDFSFAILNAASKAFNGIDLIEAINIINPNINQQVNELKTLIHIYCNHFMKTTTKDINQHFPVTKSSNVVRVFLKETLTMLFYLSTIQSLTEAYRYFKFEVHHRRWYCFNKYITDAS